MVRHVASIIDDACDFCHRIRPIVLLILYSAVSASSLYGMWLLHEWWNDSLPAIEFGQGTIAMENGRPGDMMIVHQPVKKLRDCDGVIHRVVTGVCGHHIISEKHSILKSGFEGQLTIPFQIPQEAIIGSCGFQVHARYICNPFDYVLQRQVFQSPVVPFKVKGYQQ